MKKLSALGVVVAAGLLCSVPLTLDWSSTKTPLLSIDTADARLGRPLTPMLASIAASIAVHIMVPRRRPAPPATVITTMPGGVAIIPILRASLQ
jgi:hypothetical protein